MKKIVFALQVFGIMALGPLYILLEVNHASMKLLSTKSKTAVTQKQENPGPEKWATDTYDLANQSTGAKSLTGL